MTARPDWSLDMPSELPLREVKQVVDGVELYYCTGGSRPPLLLLHAFTRSGLEWDPILDELGQYYAVIVPNLPGHGRSSLTPGDWSYRGTAQTMFHLV